MPKRIERRVATMLQRLEESVRRARCQRGLHLAMALLRILLGFALVPAGLKKVLAQPFTDPHNTGPFHEFLHAFYATGFFYQFVGALQLLAALLLFSQYWATLGALVLLPILSAIWVFCWSTQVYPTASVVTLMYLGTWSLLLWDVHKWRLLFRADASDTEQAAEVERREPQPISPVDLALWRRCGWWVVGLYLAVCLWRGEVYRPRGMDLTDPAFYVLPALLLFPLRALALERRRHVSRSHTL